MNWATRLYAATSSPYSAHKGASVLGFVERAFTQLNGKSVLRNTLDQTPQGSREQSARLGNPWRITMRSTPVRLVSSSFASLPRLIGHGLPGRHFHDRLLRLYAGANSGHHLHHWRSPARRQDESSRPGYLHWHLRCRCHAERSAESKLLLPQVNIFGGGALSFKDVTVDFWAQHILVQNNGSLLAATGA